MSKFMVVYQWEGKTHAAFFDSFSQAETFRWNAICGVDAEAELYERRYNTYVLVYY